MSKNFLGLTYSGVHDSAVSVVTPAGEVLLAAAEERFTGNKKEGRWPRHGLALVDLGNIERVCVPYLPGNAQPVVEDRPEFRELAIRRQHPPPGNQPFWRFAPGHTPLAVPR